MFAQFRKFIQSGARIAFSRRAVWVSLALILLLSSTRPTSAAIFNRKISGTMPYFGDVFSYKISPDSQYVVFEADRDTDGQEELYSVSIAGGDPVKLNAPFPAFGRILSFGFRISSDSQRVVYRADQEVNTLFEIYSAPIGGGTVAKMNGALVSGGMIVDWSIAADGQRVVYSADQEIDDRVRCTACPFLAGRRSS